MIQIGGPGPSDHPAADHKFVHTYRTFVPIFEEAGFIVDLLEYCDENGRFHYHQWDQKTGPIYRSLVIRSSEQRRRNWICLSYFGCSKTIKLTILTPQSGGVLIPRFINQIRHGYPIKTGFMNS
jgi:hypothetical protein